MLTVRGVGYKLTRLHEPQIRPLIKKFLLTHALLLALVGPASLAQVKTRQTPRQVGPSILVRWQGKPGVERYRLQLATDETFKDIVFDQAVVGRQHVVKELPPGNYFWRVAPAAGETALIPSRPASLCVTRGASRWPTFVRPLIRAGGGRRPAT